MRRGVRRPLLALVALVVALTVGYIVKAADSDDDGTPRPTPSVSSTR